MMIDTYQAGFPGNGKAVPDGAKMAKVHWAQSRTSSFRMRLCHGKLLNVDFMIKDSRKFADSGGWGYAVFDYDAASDTFKPGTPASKPPQGNDAKCGFACHTSVKTRDTFSPITVDGDALEDQLGAFNALRRRTGAKPLAS